MSAHHKTFYYWVMWADSCWVQETFHDIPVHRLGDADLCMQLEKGTESSTAWPVPRIASEQYESALPSNLHNVSGTPL